MGLIKYAREKRPPPHLLSRSTAQPQSPGVTVELGGNPEADKLCSTHTQQLPAHLRELYPSGANLCNSRQAIHKQCKKSSDGGNFKQTGEFSRVFTHLLGPNGLYLYQPEHRLWTSADAPDHAFLMPPITLLHKWLLIRGPCYCLQTSCRHLSTKRQKQYLRHNRHNIRYA